jgi:hypothetical protein
LPHSAFNGYRTSSQNAVGKVRTRRHEIVEAFGFARERGIDQASIKTPATALAQR